MLGQRVLVLALLTTLAATAFAAEPIGVPPKPVQKLDMIVGVTRAVEMTTKKPLAGFAVAVDGILDVKPDLKGPGVLLTALTPGKVAIRLTDAAGNSETVEVVVRRGRSSFVGDTFSVQLKGKLAIKDFSSSDKKIAAVKRADDKSSVQVEVSEKGKTTLTLTATDGTVEEFVVDVFPTDLILTEGESGKLQMSKKQPIKSSLVIPGNVFREYAKAPEITIEAEKPGLLQILLCGEDGSTEVKLVGVKPKK